MALQVSNAPELEDKCEERGSDETTFTKEQFCSGYFGEGVKLLGLPWNKKTDTLSVQFPADDETGSLK